jgi:hypothetical protein
MFICNSWSTSFSIWLESSIFIIEFVYSFDTAQVYSEICSCSGITKKLRFLLNKESKICIYFLKNPPSVPTLGLIYLFSKLTGTKFIIDWHNYGFTIMALKSGPRNILVRICKK